MKDLLRIPARAQRARIDEVLQLAQRELTPSAAEKARGRAALGLPEPPAAVSAPHGTARAALRASGKHGLLLSAALLGVGLGAGYWLGRSEAPAPASPPPTASTSPNEPTPPPGNLERVARADEAPSSDISPDAGTARSQRAEASHGARFAALHEPAYPARERRPSSGNLEELALMRRIERSLRSDQPALALALLAQAEAQFPASSLTEERQAAAVMAHCGLRDPGHDRRAEDFLQSRPRSVYRTRVIAACGPSGAPEAHEKSELPGEGRRDRGDESGSKEK